MIASYAIEFVSTLSASIRSGAAWQAIIDRAGQFSNPIDRRDFEDVAFEQWFARSEALKAWCDRAPRACR